MTMEMMRLEDWPGGGEEGEEGENTGERADVSHIDTFVHPFHSSRLKKRH